MKIGVCGGTFDPVHIGHMVIGTESADLLGLDQVLYIPAKIPPHKSGSTITSSEHRMAMLRIAVRDNPLFRVDDMEIRRSGTSFTVQTMEQLTEDFPDNEFYFLMGQDAFMEIETWHRYMDLFRWCRVVVVTRPGLVDWKKNLFTESITSLLNTGTVYANGSTGNYPDVAGNWSICFMDIPSLGISASDIRKRVMSGRSIRYLTPNGVAEYIYQNNLYRK